MQMGGIFRSFSTRPSLLKLVTVSALVATVNAHAFTDSEPTKASDVAKVAKVAKVIDVDTLIIGAGISGLTTALKLGHRDFLIVDAAKRAGGRVETVEYGSGSGRVRSNSGMEEYWEDNALVDLIHEFKLPVITDQSASSIVLDGTLHVLKRNETKREFLKRIFSAEEFAALDRFDWNALKILKQVDRAKASGTTQEFLLKNPTLLNTSFEGWVKSQSLPKRVAEWIRISVEAEIATRWNKTSAIEGVLEYRILVGEGMKNYKVVGGNERLIEAMVARLGTRRIVLNNKVRSIVDESQGATILTERTDASGRISLTQINAQNVIVTVPLPLLHEVKIDPPMPTNMQNAIASLDHGRYLKVHFLVKSSAMHKFERSGESILPLLSDSTLGVLYNGSTEAPGTTSEHQIITLLIYAENVAAYDGLTAEQMAEKARTEFLKKFPDLSFDIVETRAFPRLKASIASWPVGRSRLDAISDRLRTPHGRIHFAGDFTESTHSDGAIESADRTIGLMRMWGRCKRALLGS